MGLDKQSLRARAVLVRRWLLARRPAPSVADGITALSEGWDIPRADDQPVFILACGWRSGSTLLQRLVIGGGKHLVWGEPYQHVEIVRRLADGIRSLATGPRPGHVISAWAEADPEALGAKWIANLYPHPADFVEAQRALFRRLYAEPAERLGYAGWGFKEVRMGVDEARYLRLLFPEARIIFLHRNPYDAWDSYRRRLRGSVLHWPDERVWTSRQFGRHWHTTVTDVLAHAPEVGAIVVSFDDLVTEEGQAALAREIDVDLVDLARGERIGSTRASGGLPSGRLARAQLRRAVEPLAGSLGYRST